MYPVSPQAYDRAITVFSPDGRLFQVEYAKEAVKRGATAVGLVAKDGVVLAASKMAPSRLLVPASMRKIFEIDSHIATTASGLIADARRLVDIARLDAQRHRLAYSEPASVEMITRNICDLMQVYTQYGGIRPFGVALLIAGIQDERPVLYEAEPSGALTGFLADAIGAGKKEAEDFFEKEYKESINIEEGISLAISALKKTTEELSPSRVEVAFATVKKREFSILSEKELEKYLK
ncbi:MAG: archaeal proteasome endopeptidase complex subunit alpha [Candidatus Anstonellales archaeon]